MNHPILATQEFAGTNKVNVRINKAVVDNAALLAKKFHTSVDLIHVEEYPLGDKLEKSYRELDAVSKNTHVPIKKEVIVDEEVDLAIIKQALKDKCELIVMGTHGRTGASRLFVGSVAENVIQKSHIPVLLINPKAQRAQASNKAAKTPTTAKTNFKILLATDLGPNSAEAERYAMLLAQKLNAELIVVHNFFDAFRAVALQAVPVEYPVPNVSTTIEVINEYRQVAELKTKRLEKLARRKNLKFSIHFFDKPIPTPDAVLKEVKKVNPHYVVIGTHGRGYLSSVVFGSTTRELILKSPVPVITVRS